MKYKSPRRANKASSPLIAKLRRSHGYVWTLAWLCVSALLIWTSFIAYLASSFASPGSEVSSSGGSVVSIASFLPAASLYSVLRGDRKESGLQWFHDEMLYHGDIFAETLESSTSGPSTHIRTRAAAAPPKRSVVVITVPRAKPYLHAVLWSLLAQNTPEQLARTAWTVFSAAKSNELVQPLLSKLPGHVIFQKHWLPKNESATVRERWVHEEHFAYRMALSQCADDVEWCIVFQDDGVPQRQFLDHFERLVESHFSSDSVQDVALVKLFVSDWWAGFGLDFVHVREVTVMLCASVSLVIICCRVLNLDVPAMRLGLAVLVLFVGVYLSCRMLSRQQFLWWSSYLRAPANGLVPCTEAASNVAVAYPKAARESLLRFLRTEYTLGRVTPIDLHVYEWATTYGKAYQVAQSLVQHIGVYSSCTEKNQGGWNLVKIDSKFKW